MAKVIEVGELFPGAISRPVTVREAGLDIKWIGIKSDRLNSDVSKKYHVGRKRRFFLNDTPYALTKDGAFGCRRSDVVCSNGDGERTPTIIELKRLQSYPDDIIFFGDYDKQWERVGNSVPPLLMKAIATQIRHKLWKGDPLARYPKEMTYPEILEAAWQNHLAPRDPDAPTIISTFAGGGGSSLGYSMASYRELLAVEWDDNAVATFKLNFPDIPVYHGDIHNLSVEECMRLAGVKEGELDLLDGSPPCQGLSSAGKRNLNDPRNQLFREFVRLLRGLKPKVFVMENVPGLVKGKMKLIFAEIMKELKASGYQVRCKKLNAMYFYVPQSRERLIFIGVRNDLGVEVSYPKAESRPITINNSLCDNPLIDIPPELQDNRFTRLYDKVPVGGTLENVLGKGRNFNNMLKMNPNKPAQSIPKTITNRGAFSIIHWNEKRLLSITEVKRVHSYPDSIKFSGKFDKQWGCIGNSVPPLMMCSIAEHIKINILNIASRNNATTKKVRETRAFSPKTSNLKEKDSNDV